jgi:hypothetical protein
MALLGELSPHQEIYSIDECFLDLSGMRLDLIAQAQAMRKRIKHYLGLPTCIGIGHSKTLAKLANHIAKKRPDYKGVFSWGHCNRLEEDALMSSIEVSEVWGVGRRLTIKLNQLGIRSVCDLKYASTSLIRKRFGVVLERTVNELNGISCLDLEESQDEHLLRKHQIISSKSFGKPVHHLPELQEAVVSYVSRAAEKLRHQKSFCSHLLVYIRTNPFAQQSEQYANSVTIPLITGTDDTRHLAQLASQYGINLGDVEYDQQVNPIDPAIYELRNELNHVRGEVVGWKRQQEEVQNQTLLSEIEQFATQADYFEDARPTMIQLLNAGMATDLQDAYEKAIRFDPNLSEQVQQSRQAEADAARRKANNTAAKSAKAAAVSVRSSTPGFQPTTKAQDRRSLLSEQFDSMNERI